MKDDDKIQLLEAMLVESRQEILRLREKLAAADLMVRAIKENQQLRLEVNYPRLKTWVSLRRARDEGA